MRRHAIIVFVLALLAASENASTIDRERGQYYWNRLGAEALEKTLSARRNTNIAKNVIMFLGDGMDVATVTAARIYKAQTRQKGAKSKVRGEENNLVWDEFPDLALLKTYNLDKQVPDSAATATAYLCGVKTNYRMIGLDGRARRGDCESSHGHSVSSIAEWAMSQGKAGGIISTASVTHASPAAAYAHAADRSWESSVPETVYKCKDIASQLIQDFPGKDFQVILGGGKSHFLPNTTTDNITGSQGLRMDSKNLIESWKVDKEFRQKQYQFVETSEQLQQVDPTKTDYLLGLFSHDEMDFELNRNKTGSGQPSLAEMTRKAIRILSKHPRGFFLFVEGARIDHAHHDNKAKLALEETVQLDEAVRVAMELMNLNETLIVVTSDHAHAMSMTGYPDRGNPILGFGDPYGGDSAHHTTLVYTNGPGNKNNPASMRTNLTLADTEDKDFEQPAGMPASSGSHGGEDVPAFAIGPMSHLFHGIQEQSYVAHAMAYAACIGKYTKKCVHDIHYIL